MVVKDRLDIPEQAGVYLFSEAAPIYVGQTRRLRRRYDQHTGADREHNQASFAFLIARRDAKAAGINVERPRKVLQQDADFARYFVAAKGQVAAMDFQFVINADPIERSIFEIYAALHLGTTEFNSFETH